jgi:hypothetical protein
MALNLPDGYDDASTDMKRAILGAHRSEDLVEAIQDHLDYDRSHTSEQLTRSEKAEILQRLME